MNAEQRAELYVQSHPEAGWRTLMKHIPGLTKGAAIRVAKRARQQQQMLLEKVIEVAPQPVVEVRLPAQQLLEDLTEKGSVAAEELSRYELGALARLDSMGYLINYDRGVFKLDRNPEARVEHTSVQGVFDPSRKVHRFAVHSDTHFGGRQAQPHFVRRFVEEAARRDCSAILHCGDIVDGSAKMHAGFEHELALLTADQQADYAAWVYKDLQVPMYLIGGNHDGSFHKTAGLDICRMIAERNDAIQYIGPISGWLEGPNGDPNFIRMFHPGDGCSYALSYKDQKTAEYLVTQNDKVPTGFHFTGHYHKQNQLRGPNGARYLLVPSACASTAFMNAKRLINQAGVYFIEFTLDAAGRVDRCTIEDVILHPSQWTRCDYADLPTVIRKRPSYPWSS